MSGYLRLRQICLVAPELEPAVQTVRELFDVDVCHRDGGVAKYGLVNALFVFGHAFLEIVAPTREGTAAGRFIERSGGRGGYMAIFDCDDPLARRERAQQLGVRIAHVLDYPGFLGSQFHPRDCRATMLEFDHTTGGEALDGPYWPAGEHWRDGQRLDRVGGIDAIELTSPQPDELAQFWSKLIDRPLQRTPGQPTRMTFDLGEARFLTAAAGDGERLARLQVSVADPAALRAAAARRGLLSADGTVKLYGVDVVPVPLRG